MMHLLRRRDTDGLIEGSRVDHDPALDDVDAFLDTMRTEFGATPPPAPRPTLAATLDGRRPLRPASGPQVKTTFPPRRPRRRLLRPVALVAATSAVLFGGLATAGALPGPVQRTTADLGSHVGIHLPGGGQATPTARVRVETNTRRDSDAPRQHGSRGTTPPTVPSAGAPAPTVPVPPTTPALPSLPVPTPSPSGLLQPLAPLLGPTGPAGPSGPTGVPGLVDQLLH